MENQQKIGVCLVSGSNGTHMNVAQIGHKAEYFVNIFTRRPEEFSTKEIVAEIFNSDETIKGKINVVSADPKEAAEGCSIFILSCPVCAAESLLQSLKPHLPENAIVGTVFGQGGFDLIAHYVLGDVMESKNISFFSLFNIPFTCKTVVVGQRVRLQARKHFLKMCCIPNSRFSEIQKLCENLWDVPCQALHNFLEILLTPANQIIHPGRTTGIFENQDAHPFDEIPFFYQTMNQQSADNIQNLSNEIQVIKKAILTMYPSINLDSVIDIGERIVAQYCESVSDTSSLLQIFRTNDGYKNFTLPCKEVHGKYEVNPDARIFTEDIPFGLCVLKDIAEMLNVETPHIDFSIQWHQKYMGKKFLLDGKLNPAEINFTGAPTRFGFKTIDQLIAHYRA